MELKYRLLDHPFYQAWNEGKISNEQLSKYAASYLEFIERIPAYWNKIGEAFPDNELDISKIESEEKQHIPLWQQWSGKLEKVDDYPQMTRILTEFENFSASELLGAIHAFEVQQPEVANTKMKGLIDHYGFSKEDLKYFEEHKQEDVHIETGRILAEKYAHQNEFKSGFEKGSRLIYEGLDLFLS